MQILQEAELAGFVHMDIAADDPERAANFYHSVFGFAVTRLEGPEPYWLVTPPDGPGAGIGKRSLDWQKVTATIDVADVDATAAAVLAQGGRIVIPKTTIPGIGDLLTFEDTEGNILAALQAAPGNLFAEP
jgi:predicted enzyme related to lactoylglutathione lyase